MFNLFMVLGAIMLCVAPILLIISIVKTIRKNKPKKWWVLFAITIVLFFAFEIMASVFECKHEYNLIEKVSATCTEKGYSKYHCDKCGRDKTDKIDKLGHLMKIVSQVEPTEQLEGEIVRQCERCGYEEVKKVDKLSAETSKQTSSSTEPTDKTDLSIYPEAFVVACADTGIDTSQVKEWEQIEDWANGERFRFSYKRHSFIVQVNYDKTISSIKLGDSLGTAIYLQGYAPYAVDDYLVDEDTAQALIPYAQDTVKLALNYPSTAKFAWFDWSYGREGSLYQLKSSVEAKNAFGVKDELPFTVIFDLGTEGKAKCVYLELDGIVIANEMPDKPERAKVETIDKTAQGDDIRLVDGELGEYGRYDPKYQEYVDFYIPVGRYAVKNNTKNSIVMIIDESSNDEVSRLTLATGQSGEIEVKSNQHIELTFYSDVTLTKVD